MGTRFVGTAFAALVGLSLCGTALAERRTSTTALGVRVERHVGLYLPAPTSAVSLASLREERLPDVPRVFGNSQSTLLVSGQKSEALSHVSVGGSAPRVVLTAFEP